MELKDKRLQYFGHLRMVVRGTVQLKCKQADPWDGQEQGDSAGNLTSRRKLTVRNPKGNVVGRQKDW
jgi:hypothetical protein